MCEASRPIASPCDAMSLICELKLHFTQTPALKDECFIDNGAHVNVRRAKIARFAGIVTIWSHLSRREFGGVTHRSGAIASTSKLTLVRLTAAGTA